MRIVTELSTDAEVNMTRRGFHQALGGLLLSLPALAQAQTYPSRPVRLLVGFPPGGTTDIVARRDRPMAVERLGSPFVVENKPGAGTNLATETVARAAADGQRAGGHAGQRHQCVVLRQARLRFARDMVPIVSLVGSPYVLEVIPSVPANTVPELIAYARANPGKAQHRVVRHRHRQSPFG